MEEINNGDSIHNSRMGNSGNLHDGELDNRQTYREPVARLLWGVEMEQEYKQVVITKEDADDTRRRIAALKERAKTLFQEQQNITQEWTYWAQQLSVWNAYEMVRDAKESQLKDTIAAIDDIDRQYAAQRAREITTENPEWLEYYQEDDTDG